MFNHNSVFYDYLLELTEHVHKLDNGEIDRNGDGFADLQKLECRIINAYSNGYFGSMDKCATANYSISDYLPETIPKEEQSPDYFTQAEIDRLQAQKQEYMVLLDCIEREQADLQAEYKQASVKRRSAISSKLTSLASKHAATNRTLSGIDSKIEKLYNQ